jgi:ubiquinone/menaquinone biosynthesis C-methylase UbiE
MIFEPAAVGTEVAAVFDRAAPHYDRALPVFESLAADLVAWHAPSPDARVLDLCTGSGACLRTLAKRAGAAGLVGVDLSHGMLTRARGTLPGGIPLFQSDAHRLPFADGSFDAYYCAVSWQLLARPELVLAELRRVGRGAAGLALSVLAASRHNAHFTSRVLLDFLGSGRPPFLATLDALLRRSAEEAFATAGWRTRAREEITRRFEFQTAQQWLTWQESQLGRSYFDLVPYDRQVEFRARLLEEAERTRVTNGLWLELTVIHLYAEPEGTRA